MITNNNSIHIKRTPIHKAVFAGKLDKIKDLIGSNRYQLDEQDSDKNTPLHLAVQLGDRAIAAYLLMSGASTSLLNSDGESVIDLALKSATSGLVDIFLSPADCSVSQTQSKKMDLSKAIGKKNIEMVKELLLSKAPVNQLNNSRTLSLHLAIQVGEAKIVSLLLEEGKADPLKRGSGGATAFHLASFYGRVDLLRLLKSHTSSYEWVTMKDRQKRTPLQLAKDHATHSLLQTWAKEAPLSLTSRSLRIQRSADPLYGFEIAFKEAAEKNSIDEQIFWLKVQAKERIQRKQFTVASHLLNAALVLAKKKPQRSTLFSELEQVEAMYAAKKGGVKRIRKGQIEAHRNELAQMRSRARKLLDQGGSILNLQTTIMKGFEKVLKSLVKESLESLGKRDLKGFCVILLGSLGRGEPSPYSDLDYAFLISESNRSNLDFFDDLADLLALKILNMGETPFKFIRYRDENQRVAERGITPTGFRVDTGGLEPRGKPGIYKLIGTPNTLANVQSPEWFKKHDCEIVLVNALTTVRYLMGDGKLFQEYQKRIDHILNPTLQRERALSFLKSYVEEFSPQLNSEKIDLRAFDVKNELYRFPHTVLIALAQYYQIPSSSTLKSIQELVTAGVLSSKGGDNLREAFEITLRLRMEAQLFYQSEKEILFQSFGKSDHSAQGLLAVDEKRRKQIQRVCQTLVPLTKATSSFLRGTIDKTFYKNFLDSEVGSTFYMQETNLFKNQYELKEEMERIEQGTALFAADPDTLAKFALKLSDMGENRKAITYFEQVLVWDRQAKDEKDRVNGMITTLLNISACYFELGERDRALDYCNQALRTKDQKTFPEPILHSGGIWMRMGEIYRGSKRWEEAIKAFQTAIKESEEWAFFDKDADRYETYSAYSHLGIATVYGYQKNWRKAREHYLKSKQTFIENESLGLPHPFTIQRIIDIWTTTLKIPNWQKDFFESDSEEWSDQLIDIWVAAERIYLKSTVDGGVVDRETTRKVVRDNPEILNPFYYPLLTQLLEYGMGSEKIQKQWIYWMARHLFFNKVDKKLGWELFRFIEMTESLSYWKPPKEMHFMFFQRHGSEYK